MVSSSLIALEFWMGSPWYSLPAVNVVVPSAFWVALSVEVGLVNDFKNVDAETLGWIKASLCILSRDTIKVSATIGTSVHDSTNLNRKVTEVPAFTSTAKVSPSAPFIEGSKGSYSSTALTMRSTDRLDTVHT